MNWIEALINLYDSNADIAGEIQTIKKHNTGNKSSTKNKGKSKKNDEKLVVLPPLYHDVYSADYEIQLNEKGEFRGIQKIVTAEQKTIIPVTEASASRTSNKKVEKIAPHPLIDELSYLTDHWQPKKYECYIRNLEAWNSSPYSHPKVTAILTYLKKKTLLQDIQSGFSKQINIDKLGKERVRFSVSIPDDTNKMGTWEDKSLFESHIQYVNSKQQNEDLCYLTGRRMVCTEKHPKKILPGESNAKLISSNDKSGFTFLGRFTDSTQAVSIGYESSQKLHSALKWIFNKQGTNQFGNYYVAWESNLIPMPEVYLGTSEFIIEDEPEDNEANTENNSVPGQTKFKLATQFNQAMVGYYAQIKEETISRMVIMSLDVATNGDGRASVTYFRELETSRYLDNILAWHQSCCWLQPYYDPDSKKRLFYEGIPSLFGCIQLIYGQEGSGSNPSIVLRQSNNQPSPILKSTFQRLIPCIIERRKIPVDIVRTAIQRASSPLSYNRLNWESVLAVACSFVKKYYVDFKNKEFDMKLDESCTDRSYLYGRLLAVADRIEYLTFEKYTDDKRQTNAKRFMNVFAKRPFQVWQKIEEKIQPYLMKLAKPARIHYSKLLDEIHSYFENTDDFSSNQPLDGLYLLGYHCQSAAMKAPFADKSDTSTQTEEQEQ